MTHKAWCPASQSCNCGEKEFPRDLEQVDPVMGMSQDRFKEMIDAARQQGREEERERLRQIDWTFSQSGIAIGTKKVVVEEALRFLSDA